MHRFFTFMGVCLAAVSAHAMQPPMDGCQNQFFKDSAPDLQAVEQADWPKSDLTPVCFHEFGVVVSNLTKTPLWSGEHLTRDRIEAAKKLHRDNTFHSEKAIERADRATLGDYRGSHYDRGHMTPEDDMGTMQAQFESFSLANMVPQDACNNEIIWKAIENSVRNYVLEHGDVYVVTGPIYDTLSLTIGKGVKVPTRLFKAIYDPRTNEALIVVTDNKNVQSYATATAEDLENWTGVNPFPAAHDVSLSLQLPALPVFSGVCAKAHS